MSSSLIHPDRKCRHPAALSKLALVGVDLNYGFCGICFGSYAAPIFTMIESGAILIAVTITMLTLYLTGNAAALMCTDIATQIAVSISFPTLPRHPCSTRRELTTPPPRAHRRSSRT